MFKIIFLTISIILILFAGCEKPTTEATTTRNKTSEVQKTLTEATSKDKKYENTSGKKIQVYDVGGGEITQEKYRQCYYRISYQFALLVDSQELRSWKETIFSKDPNETNEMIMKRFVLDFNISREDFDKANLELAKVLYAPNSPLPSMNPKDYINQEMFEIYNADIIYTFDDEIINEYYLSHEYPFVYESDYEQAVENGEYISRTEKWVDIDKMEAEIIAKYGEAEIVTEAETTVEDETENSDTTEGIQKYTVQ